MHLSATTPFTKHGYIHRRLAHHMPVAAQSLRPPGSGATGSLVRIRCIWRTTRRALTPPGPGGMMPPREGPRMERRGSRLSRRAFVVGVGAAGVSLLDGCGLPVPPSKTPVTMARLGYLSSDDPDRPVTDLDRHFHEALRELGWA